MSDIIFSYTGSGYELFQLQLDKKKVVRRRESNNKGEEESREHSTEDV